MSGSGLVGFERKTVVEVRTVSDRVVTGFPSVFGNVDDGGDLVEPGAYVKTLQERGDRLRWLWQHDKAQPPIARVVEIGEVGREVLPGAVLARFPEATGALRVQREYLDTPRGNEVLAGIRAGALSELSMGMMGLRRSRAGRWWPGRRCGGS
jgi:HK97 family phage prohead protease